MRGSEPKPGGSLRRVLVATRGESAVRVIQACRELGLESVAVYSEADALSQHVRMADEAHALGRSTGAYMDIERIVEAALEARADTVHPGYGMLSENPAFARACTASGLVFVGPSPEAMAAVGDRSRARNLAESCRVPVFPDEMELIRDDAHAVIVALRLGFPIVVRALCGASGRCQEVVRQADDLNQAISRVRREGMASYSDDAICLERFIAGRRRVDVDVLADMHGAAVSLGSRECPVQPLRRRLVEIAPANISEPLRRRLDTAALSMVVASGFHGVATFEFLVNGEEYYYLETARCLQAAQAATESVTRVDIAQAQLRIAGGSPLWLGADDVRPMGHALSCRVHAGDIEQPGASPGETVADVHLPTGPGLRVDGAACSGSDPVSLPDGLIAQITAWAPDADMSRRRMIRALGELEVEGISTEVPSLLRLLRHPRLVDGHLPAELVELVDGEGTRERPNGRQPSVSSREPAGRKPQTAPRPANERQFQVSIEGKPYVVAVAELSQPARTSVRSHEALRHWTRSDGIVRCPMRGTLVEMRVTEGSQVRGGAVLCTIEAMKMENEVLSPHDGVVAGIVAHAGESVAAGATLMRVIAAR